MRIVLVLILAAAFFAMAAPIRAADPGTDGYCRCEASHLLGSGCRVSGPCPCECHCPVIGSCSCSCSGHQLDRPPAG